MEKLFHFILKRQLSLLICVLEIFCLAFYLLLKFQEFLVDLWWFHFTLVYTFQVRFSYDLLYDILFIFIGKGELQLTSLLNSNQSFYFS